MGGPDGAFCQGQEDDGSPRGGGGKAAPPKGKPANSTEGKATGYVKFFNNEKGYGFIANDDGTGDLFVHHSALYCDGFRSLAENEQVEFDVEDQGDGKFRAINVTGPEGAPCVGKPDDGGDDDGYGGGGGGYGGGGGGYGGGGGGRRGGGRGRGRGRGRSRY